MPASPGEMSDRAHVVRVQRANVNHSPERIGLFFAALCAINGAFVPAVAKLTTGLGDPLLIAAGTTAFAGIVAAAVVTARREWHYLLRAPSAVPLTVVGALGTSAAFVLFYAGAQRATAIDKDEKWDLFLCCLAAPHRGGHKFWDVTNIKDEPSEEHSNFENSLKDIYLFCDNAIGEIIKEVDDNTDILIFSLHGMGTNSSLADKLPQMISNILNGVKESKKNGKNNYITSLRNLIPLELRSNLRKLLPFWLQDKMTAYWRTGKINWSKTKALSLVADLQGYIQINLKGREKEGIVEPGEEYGNLCAQLIEGLKTFKDAQTNEPIVESIKRKDELFTRGKGFDYLPDLLVNWKYKPAAGYKKIVSTEYGEVEFPSAGKNLDGRSGNHRTEGFLIAVGDNFKVNSTFEKGHHIIDLAPTILNLLNIEKPKEMEGESISIQLI